MRIARVLALCLLPSLATAQSTTLQPVQVLHRFTPSPANPNGPLVQVPDGSFYGVTATGIIRLTTAGQVTQVATFLDDTPVGALVRASDGALYGATQSFSDHGTIFRFDPVTGALRTVHAFQSSAEGRNPIGGLVAVGGSLYGVTRFGPGERTFGTIFHVVVATGEVVTDHAFSNTPTIFAVPASPLTVGPDGLLYGTTGIGTLYRFDPGSGAVTRLREFGLAEGSNPSQLAFAAGHASAGVTAPALEWFLAEGATGPFFDLFILIANPNPTPATIAIDYLLLGGGVQSKTYTVDANSRYTIWVDDEELPAGSGLKPLANAALSSRVRSTNAVPVVVERTMWWPGPALTADYWYEAHNSPGATATALRWAFAGAEVGIPGLETYVLIANPSPGPGRAVVTAHFLDGQSATRTYDLPPQSRTNVALGTNLQQTFLHGPFGVVVDSVGDSPVPIVVEHSTYSSPGNVTWASGSNALATPVP